MPYSNNRIRKDYDKKQYLLKKKSLLRLCQTCGVRSCAFGETCKPCSKSNQGITWARKTAIFRDDSTCQICGLREIGLVEVDHIVPVWKRPDLYCSIDNLMVLCPNCHKRKSIRDRKDYHANHSNTPQLSETN